MSDDPLSLSLKVDDREVIVGPYVREVFIRVIEGLASTLRGVGDWKTLELKIEGHR